MYVLLDILRQSLGSLRSRRRFSVFAIVALGIGIGANCVVFALLDGLFLRQMPYQDVDRLVEISLGGDSRTSPDELREARSFVDVAAFGPRGFSVREGQGFRNLYGFQVSANIFQMLGVRVALGRPFEPEDQTRPVVLLSYRYWRQISGRPDIIGQTLSIAEDQPRTIVGVLQPDFTLQVRDANIFVPAIPEQRRTIARLRPGVTPNQAEQEIIAIFREARRGSIPPDTQPHVTPITQSFRPNNADTISLFQAAVGVVLLITCANLANRLLVDGAARHREFAIRAAIGAGRARLFGQLITENVIIALGGGCLGVLLAGPALESLQPFLPANIIRMARGANGLAVDSTVIALAFVLSLVTVLVFGLVPAIRASRLDLASAIKETRAGSSPGRKRFGNILVAAEVGLALMLLIAGGLTLKSLVGLRNRDLGFTAERILRVPVELPRSRYPVAAQRIQALKALEERLAALPGVEGVTIAGPQFFPFGGPAIGGAPFTTYDRPEAKARADFYYATPTYFQLLKIPLLQGRFFSDKDAASGARVGIVSQVVADRYDIREGSRVRQRAEGEWITIIGVVGNVQNPVGNDFTPVIYVPLAQTEVSGGVLMIRTAGDPLSIVPAVRREVLAADPNASELRVANLATAVASYTSAELFTTSVFGTFAAIGLLLAAVGVFAVTRYWVSITIPEIGIRIALGADRSQILRHVLFRSCIGAAAGVIAGVSGAFAMQRVLASQLHGISPLDPGVITTATIIVSLTAILSALVPALAAARVDPTIALRQE